MNPDPRLAALAKGREIAKANKAARGPVPNCTRIVKAALTRGQVGSSVLAQRCGALTTQNEPERERGVYWCPSCQRYPWGCGGGRSGGGPDIVPAEAWGAA